MSVPVVISTLFFGRGRSLGEMLEEGVRRYSSIYY